MLDSLEISKAILSEAELQEEFGGEMSSLMLQRGLLPLPGQSPNVYHRAEVERVFQELKRDGVGSVTEFKKEIFVLKVGNVLPRVLNREQAQRYCNKPRFFEAIRTKYEIQEIEGFFDRQEIDDAITLYFKYG